VYIPSDFDDRTYFKNGRVTRLLDTFLQESLEIFELLQSLSLKHRALWDEVDWICRV
jgi:hypothetical protein